MQRRMLVMVYGMRQRHGAQFTIDSKLGAGTTMRLLFPVHAPAFSSMLRLSAAQAPVRHLRILVVRRALFDFIGRGNA